jgi:outer membrane protein assembly factor BamB
MERIQSSDLSEEYSWPMYRHDSGHTGYAISPAPDTNLTAWKFKTGAQVFSSPAVAYGRVFVGSWDGYLYALDENTGTLLWGFRTETEIGVSPAVFDGRVFIVSDPPFVDDGVTTTWTHLYCLNASNGEIIWSFYTGYPDNPTVVDGKVFIFSEGPYQYNYILNVLDMISGRLLWNTRVFSPDASVKDDRVFISDYGEGYLASVNATDGTLIWENSQVVWANGIVASDDKVFAFHHKLLPSGNVDDTKYLSSFNKTTGTLIWQREIAYSCGSSSGFLAVAYDKLFVRSSDYYGNSFLYALNETTGVEIWKYKLEAYESAPSVADGKVFLGLVDGSIYAFNESSGALIWTYKTGERAGSPAIANGRLFVGSGDGYVYAIGSRVLDKVTIIEGGTMKDSLYIGEIGTVWYKAISEYDNVPFDETRGILYVNGSAMTWSPINNRWEYNYTTSVQGPRTFKVTGVLNNLYNETIIKDLTGTISITWWLPTTLTISLTPSTTYIGFKVEIDGKLSYPNGTGVSEAGLLLSYSVTGGNNWIDITSVTTDSDGVYSVVWMPAATGNYLLKVSWEGKQSSWILGAIDYTTLAVTPYGQEYVFSVSSNSTVSNLAFNSTTRTISFTVSGPSGTNGYARVFISKELVANISDLKVYIDENQVNYVTTSTDSSWILYVSYEYSTHDIVIVIPEFPSVLFLPLLLVSTLSAVVFSKKRRQKKRRASKNPF